MKKKLLFVLLIASISSLFFSCEDDEAPVPTITSFTPDYGVKDVTVTITGTNFSTVPASNIVKFNGTVAVVTASTATSITTTVPAGATTGTISIEVGGQSVTSISAFRVDLLFKATLDGASERPTANTSTATGSATLTFNNESKTISIAVTYTGMTATASHIHKGDATVAGGVVFGFTAPLTSPINYTSVPLSAAQEADLNANLYYVNIHSATYPGGEIRGQLVKQ